MKKKVKLILWAVVIGLFAVYGVYSSMQPLKTELLTINARDIEKVFIESGTVVAANKEEIYSALGGKINSIHVKEGDAVKSGQLLVSMDTREIDYQISQLEGQIVSLRGQEMLASGEVSASGIEQQRLAVEQVEVQLQAAVQGHERTAALFEAGAVSSATYDETVRAVKELEILLAQQQKALGSLENITPSTGTRQQFSGLQASLRAQIDLLRYQKGNAELYASIDGIVDTFTIREGATVMPGTPLTTIFSPERYEVECYLLAADMRKVYEGMTVRLTDPDVSEEEIVFQGVIVSIAPSAQDTVSALGLVEQRVKVRVDIQEQTAQLRPGYALDVIFVTQREDNRLVVPKTTLFPYEDGSAVWAVRDGKATVQPVEKGMETDDEVVILSGISDGEQIIRNPRIDGINEGKKVTD